MKERKSLFNEPAKNAPKPDSNILTKLLTTIALFVSNLFETVKNKKGNNVSFLYYNQIRNIVSAYCEKHSIQAPNESVILEALTKEGFYVHSYISKKTQRTVFQVWRSKEKFDQSQKKVDSEALDMFEGLMTT